MVSISKRKNTCASSMSKSELENKESVPRYIGFKM